MFVMFLKKIMKKCFEKNAKKVALDVRLMYVLIYIDINTFLMFGCLFVCYLSWFNPGFIHFLELFLES